VGTHLVEQVAVVVQAVPADLAPGRRPQLQRGAPAGPLGIGEPTPLEGRALACHLDRRRVGQQGTDGVAQRIVEVVQLSGRESFHRLQRGAPGVRQHGHKATHLRREARLPTQDGGTAFLHLHPTESMALANAPELSSGDQLSLLTKLLCRAVSYNSSLGGGRREAGTEPGCRECEE
jgi:hypothetical protein